MCIFDTYLHKIWHFLGVSKQDIINNVLLHNLMRFDKIMNQFLCHVFSIHYLCNNNNFNPITTMNPNYNSNVGGPQVPPVIPTQPQPEPKKSRKGAIIAAVIATLVILGGGVAAFFLLRNSDKSPSSTDSSTALSENIKENDATGKGGDFDLDDNMDKVGGKGDTDISKDDNRIDVDDNSTSNNDDAEVAEVKKRISRYQYSRYHNDRFNYDLDVPDFMVPRHSQNGDGVKFFYKDIMLMTYASHNALETDAVKELNYRDADATRNYLSSNSFCISGKTDDGKLYEEKAVLKDDVWYTTRLEYPAKYKSFIGSLSQIVTYFEP